MALYSLSKITVLCALFQAAAAATACLSVEGTNANLNGQYEYQSVPVAADYSWRDHYTRTDDSMVIRTGNGGWNFCVASGGVVVEPCYSQFNRQGYVADVQNQPAASKISVWGNPGDSSISFGCMPPPSGSPACSGTRTEANPSTSPDGVYSQAKVVLPQIHIEYIGLVFKQPVPFHGLQTYKLDLEACAGGVCEPIPKHETNTDGRFIAHSGSDQGSMFIPRSSDPQNSINQILKIQWCPDQNYFLVKFAGQLLEPLRHLSVLASALVAEPSAKAAATHGAGSLIVGTLGVALVAALAVVKSRFGANAKVPPTAPVLV